MTGIQPEITASPFAQNPWKRFRNASGETIPPFSVMRITGATNNHGEITFTVALPNATFCRSYLVSGPVAIANGDSGLGTTLAQAGYVAYNSGSGSPAYGEEWGAKEGQWELEKDRPGFIIEGGIKFTAGVNAVAAAQREVTQLLAINREDMDQGQTCAVDIYFRDIANNMWRKSEYSILAVYDWFLNDGETIEQNTKLIIGWHAVWVITGAYCSPTDLEELQPTIPPQAPPELPTEITEIRDPFNRNQREAGKSGESKTGSDGYSDAFNNSRDDE